MKNERFMTGLSLMPRRHRIVALLSGLAVSFGVFAFLAVHPSIGQATHTSRVIGPSLENEHRQPQFATAEIVVREGSSPYGSPSSQDPDQAKEEALLRVTLAMLDLKTAELASQLRKTQTLSPPGKQEQISSVNAAHDQEVDLESRIKRLQHQKRVVAHRLDELVTEEHRSKIQARPLATAERYTDVTGVIDAKVHTAAVSISLGFLCGMLYLTVLLWRFRPVRNVEALKRILDMNHLSVGTIGEITR